jgi:hypothetical protein
MATDWGLASAWGRWSGSFPSLSRLYPNASTIAHLVHPSVILELNLPSYHLAAAKRSKAGPLEE